MDRKLIAGREYVEALNKLGFAPDVACWAIRGQEPQQRLELLLVTTWADTVGPKAVYDLLFEAYDASATPKEIDPFIVSMFSPNSLLGAEMVGMIGKALRKEGPLAAPDVQPMLIMGMMDYVTIPDWVFTYRKPQSTRFDDQRRFAAFQRNVHQLAA